MSITKQILNPYSRTQQHLRRAFEDGVKAAISSTDRQEDYAPEEQEERTAWLDGFLTGREARAPRS